MRRSALYHDLASSVSKWKILQITLSLGFLLWVLLWFTQLVVMWWMGLLTRGYADLRIIEPDQTIALFEGSLMIVALAVSTIITIRMAITTLKSL